ncbi:general odorant-binding protein 71 isoform X2 [Venturia canescens]|uniref:general odorant-binding protein 71 isoform X2 n=1 Tax=Venturia canescens TaxID=32260 RepID=UPI001C9D004C|nr:general odorant-binding protein 71 isoform X2 [Venturia canescens]
MRILSLNVFFCVVFFLFVDSGESLRCRSGNQQSNDQMHKIMQTCRKKYSSTGNKNENDYTSGENDSSDEDSTSSMSLDEELFFGNSNKRSSGNTSRHGGNNGQSLNGNYGENRRNDRHKQDTNVYNRMSNPSNYTWMNERTSGMSNQNENRYYQNAMQSQNQENNNNRRDRAECMTQCLFDELNMVDQRGFPERGSVIEVMTREIQDPSLRDFIEESISECYHYLKADPNNREKCTFANNLMNCFADKGRDKCEDWEDQ